jgi:hypothetical protein
MYSLIHSVFSVIKCVLSNEILNVVSMFCFTAVSSTRPGLDSTSCILVEDARAVAQDEEPRDVTSSQSPTEGKYESIMCISVGFVLKHGIGIQQNIQYCNFTGVLMGVKL